MRDVDPGLYAALTAANDKGLVPRRLVRLTGKSFSNGNATEAMFWTGDGEQAFTVESSTDDGTVTRTYQGGVSLETTSIPLVSDLTIQNVSITLNVLHPYVADFIRGSDVRLGKCEVHDVLLDTKSRNPVSFAVLIWLGEIDGSPIDTGKVGDEELVTVRTNSDVISMLSRTNPAKSSYQEQKLRDGDEWGLYGNTVATWKVPWGQEDTK